MSKVKNFKKGFSLIEIMLAIALSAVLIPAFVSAFHFSIFSTSQGENFSKAYGRAQEQMEAVYFLKNTGDPSWDWENTPEETPEGSFYHIEKSGDSWILANDPIVSDSTDDVQFTQKISIKDVRRLADGSIDPSGTIDPERPSKFVTVYVEWMENGQTQSVSLDSLVTKY